MNLHYEYSDINILHHIRSVKKNERSKIVGFNSKQIRDYCVYTHTIHISKYKTSTTSFVPKYHTPIYTSHVYILTHSFSSFYNSLLEYTSYTHQYYHTTSQHVQDTCAVNDK